MDESDSPFYYTVSQKEQKDWTGADWTNENADQVFDTLRKAKDAQGAPVKYIREKVRTNRPNTIPQYKSEEWEFIYVPTNTGLRCTYAHVRKSWLQVFLKATNTNYKLYNYLVF